MCICINCKFVKICSTYDLIEKQHNLPFTKTSNCIKFIPHYSIINVNIIVDKYTQFDWDVVECLSFIEEPGKWL